MGKTKKKLKVDELVDKLESGHIYRREDLKEFSNAVDRHIAELLERNILRQAAPGVHVCCKRPGKATPPDEDELIKAFLRDDRYLIIRRDSYKAVGLPPVSIHANKTVYNHKRHGKIRLDGVQYDFKVKPHFPSKVSTEFLLVDIANNLSRARDKRMLKQLVVEEVLKLGKAGMKSAIKGYAGASGRVFFRDIGML